MGLVLRGAGKRLGGQFVFGGVNLELGEGEKVALVGRNGCGKSTLLRVLAGLEPLDAGRVHASGRVALLAQQVNLPRGTVLDAVTPVELRAVGEALARALESLSDPTPGHLEVYAQAEERYRLLGGYDFTARAEAVLAGLELSAAQLTARLSGGQQRRVMLAALLLTPAGVLLLDEPTNHLDAPSLAWLEGWVRESSAGVMIVSHDRAFLDACVSRVLELERGALHAYPGNYSAAMTFKRARREAQERQYAAQARRKRALETEMHRLRSQGESAGHFNHKRAGNQPLMLAKNKAEAASRTYARRAKALEKRLEDFDVVEKPFRDRTRVEVPLPEVPVGATEVLRVQGLWVRRGERLLLSGLDFTVRRGEKLALLGRNGSGKSSLIAVLLGQRDAAAGAVTRAAGLSVYWAGQHGEELSAFTTLEDALRDAQSALRQQDLHHLLAQLGLPRQPGFPLAALSGGQRTRLTLARLAVTRAQLLVLDEPTNHLDVEAIEALEELLVAYAGTVVFASHDRRLVERVATRSLRLHGANGATDGFFAS